MKDFDHKQMKEVDWVMGSCLIVPRSLIDKIGQIFNKRFYMYFEDTDLCRRTWKAGFKVIYYPEAQVIHDHGRGSAGRPWYLAPFIDKLAREHIKSWIKYFLN